MSSGSNNSNSTSGGASGSIKDSFEKKTGGLANLFEKLKNKKIPAQANASTLATSTASANANVVPHSSSFSSLLASAVDSAQTSGTAANLIQNLAISFHKNVINNQNSASSANTASNGPSLTGVVSAPSCNKANSLVIIDDDTYDDDESSFDCDLAIKTQPLVKTSQSDFNLKNVSLLSDDENVAPSVNALTNTSANTGDSKMTSSTSLQKITSDVDSVTSVQKADSLRKRFRDKKASFEHSIESIKNKVGTTASVRLLVNLND